MISPIPKKIIRCGLVGAGAMGRAIAYQIAATAGMEISWVADHDESALQSVAAILPGQRTGTSVTDLLGECPVDVFVEATHSIGPAAAYCLSAIDSGSHIVLMNAEVDLALGPLLAHEARKQNLVVTSDAGDQHGVLASMITEAQQMGFEIIQAGNIKGFLDRYATPDSLAFEAKKRRLSPTQCCAYTDGTKLHIEMAVLANALGYLPPPGGMTGPRAANVQEALHLFDFSEYGNTPRIDYLLGAEPGGGVYLVVRPLPSLPPEQAFYLDYYKLGPGPEYLLYRPYHLCHLETPKAILAAAAGLPILPPHSRTCDVHAFAKRDLPLGTSLRHAIGSADLYGIVEPLQSERIPIALLENETFLKQPISKDEPLTLEHLDLPECLLTRLWLKQSSILRIGIP